MKEDISDNKAIEWLNEFYLDKNFDAIKGLYSHGSYNEILSVGRRELSHSSFLTWLFDIDGSHSLQGFALLQLLKIVLRRCIQQQVGSKLTLYMADVYNENVSFGDMFISKEAYLNKGRADILINCRAHFRDVEKNLVVIIENKVNSKEASNQTDKYYKHYYKDNDSDICVFAYLTPKSKEELDAQNQPSCHCKNFVEINYQDILDDILEPAFNKVVSERTSFIINEYIRCLGMPIADMENKNKKKLIMATSKQTREMLAAFWNKHNSLITAAMGMIEYDPDQDPEVRKKIGELLNAYSTAGKDKTHYVFDSNLHKGKNAIIYGVLSFLLNNHVKIEELNSQWEGFLKSQKGALSDFPKKGKGWTVNRHEDFEDKDLERELKILQNKLSKGEIIIFTAEKYREFVSKSERKSVLKHDYSQLEIESDRYYYYNQWGWKNIDYFIKFYRDIFEKKYKKEIELRY